MECIAKIGPTNGYAISKKSGRAYSFVFNSLKEMEKRKLAVLLRREPTKRGTKSKIYDLTFDGVLLVLKNVFYLPDMKIDKIDFSNIIKRYGSMLPLVFGKYEYFKEIGLENMYLLRLNIIVRGYTRSSFRKGTGYYPWLEKAEQITRYFYLFDFSRLYNSFLKNFDPKVWLNALRNDKEIKEYVIEELQQDKKNLEDHARVITKTISYLENREQVITDIMKFFFEK